MERMLVVLAAAWLVACTPKLADPKRYRCEARCMMESDHAVGNMPEIEDCPKKCAAR